MTPEIEQAIVGVPTKTRASMNPSCGGVVVVVDGDDDDDVADVV